MMINIGGFIGPFLAGFLYKVDWKLVFLMSVITIAINFIFVLFFFREPDRAPSDKTFIAKYTEYVGRIAPADRKALYMGTSVLPIAIGHFAAGWISGKPFEVIADKYYLLSRHWLKRDLVLIPKV
jgi:MFS family permease